jgi:hypothetical protein
LIYRSPEPKIRVTNRRILVSVLYQAINYG